MCTSHLSCALIFLLIISKPVLALLSNCPDLLNPLYSHHPSQHSHPWAKTIKKNTNSTRNKSQTHRAKQYEVSSFLSTDCELSTETCSKNVYSLGPLFDNPAMHSWLAQAWSSRGWCIGVNLYGFPVSLMDFWSIGWLTGVQDNPYGYLRFERGGNLHVFSPTSQSIFQKWRLLSLPWKVSRNICRWSHPNVHCASTDCATEHARAGLCARCVHRILVALRDHKPCYWACAWYGHLIPECIF